MSILHAYTHAVADGTATSVVRPSDWNSSHVIQYAISGNTAGVSTVAGTDIKFNGGNNITLSGDTLNNQIIINGPNQTNQAIGVYVGGNTAGESSSSTMDARSFYMNMPSELSAGMSAGSLIISYAPDFFGGYVVGNTTGQSSSYTNDLKTVNFSGAGAVSIGWSNSSMIFSAPVQSVQTQGVSGISAGTQSATSGQIVFSNSNNVTFGLSGSTRITAQVAANAIAISNSTTYTSGTVAFAAAGAVSLSTNGQTVTISASNQSTQTQNLHNVTLSGNTSGVMAQVSSGTMTLAGGNNITLSQNGNAVTIVGPAPGVVNQTGPNIADSASTITSGTVVFSNANGVSFGINGQTMTASVNDVTMNRTFLPTLGDLTTIGAPINNSASVQMFNLPAALSVNEVVIPMSISVATTTNNSSAGLNMSATMIIGTRTGSTINSVSSTTFSNFMSWSSNATGSATGGRLFRGAWNLTLPADDYWQIMQISTAATGGGLTGAATTSMANTVTLLGVGTAQFGAFTWANFGAATNSSIGFYGFGPGLNSSTGGLSALSMSNITAAGTAAQRALVAVIFNKT